MLKGSRSFLGRIAPIVSRSKVSWKSRYFIAAPIGSPEAAIEVVRLSNETRVEAEIDAEVKRLGGTKSPALWNQYFKAYDKVVGYCDGYVSLLEKAHAVLPLRGRLMDIGAGTGNFSARLVAAAQSRQVVAVDQSATGLGSAKKKLLAFDAAEDRFEIQAGDIRHLVHQLPGRLDGAVMNNVLYTLSSRERLPFLKRVFQILKPGASFFLSDPRAEIRGSSTVLETFLENIAGDAAKNQSPMNGFDVALVAHINREILCKENAFLESKKLSELALAAGFSIVAREAVYYDTCTFLHLKKAIRLGRRVA